MGILVFLLSLLPLLAVAVALQSEDLVFTDKLVLQVNQIDSLNELNGLAERLLYSGDGSVVDEDDDEDYGEERGEDGKLEMSFTAIL